MNRKKQRVAAFLMAALPIAALACGRDDDYIGTICMTAAQWCPRGTLEANGQLLNIQNYSSLVEVIGFAYGGDGTKTFALPDLRGRSPIGIGQGPGPIFVAQGAMLGAQQVTLTQAQLPSHTHAFDPGGGTGSVNVSLKVSTGPGQTDTASATNKYLAVPQQVPDGGGGGLAPLALWSNSLSGAVEIGGLSATTTLSSGSIKSTGEGLPITVQSPVLGVRFCVVTQGSFPPRN